MFVSEMEGTLMELAEAAETRFRYVVWFDYTRRAINQIAEGSMLAVPNFASNGDTRHYSVLEVATVLPMHYALQGGSGGYPGFVVEAARSAAEDWEAQEHESTEETTKIRVVAIPTGLEIVERLDGQAKLCPESNMAMVGSRVHILDTEYTNLVANNGIERTEGDLTVIGTLARDPKVDIIVRIDELYRTHFAIFGFTGVGKSNLLSTIVAKVLADAKRPVKLVFFDLMSEYTGLLADQLLADKVDGRLLILGRHTLPEGLFKFINQQHGAPSLDEAVGQLDRYTLLPKALVKDRSYVKHALRELIQQERMRFFHDAQSVTVYDLFFTESVVTWAKDRRAANWTARKDVCVKVLRVAQVGDYKSATFSPATAKRIRELIEAELEKTENAAFKRDGDFTNHLTKLQELERATAEHFAAGTTLSEIVNNLNDPDRSSLWVVQAHNPDDLRSFAKKLGEKIYEDRRLTGRIDPLVSFVFDEADEFIRREAAGSHLESAEIAQTLARRGRKFGLGIGIATQRIRYLDTNIMAQPHTYFISKLPRMSDRQAVAEAFGISEEMLNQTFKFTKGQWLLISHDATGLEAIPVPIRTPDANQRLSKWLHARYGATGQAGPSGSPGHARSLPPGSTGRPIRR